jgi:hypothetical protein
MIRYKWLASKPNKTALLSNNGKEITRVYKTKLNVTWKGWTPWQSTCLPWQGPGFDPWHRKKKKNLSGHKTLA